MIRRPPRSTRKESSAASDVCKRQRQLLTPDDKLGRIVAATRVVGIGSAAIGALLGGAIADQFGLVDASLLAAGAVLFAAALAFALLGRRV